MKPDHLPSYRQTQGNRRVLAALGQVISAQLSAAAVASRGRLDAIEREFPDECDVQLSRQ